MDYHVTTAEMDLARQLHEMNLQWPYGTGDQFCTDDSDEMEICLEIQMQGGDISVSSHSKRHALEEVRWLPKRTQAIQWLNERGWKLTIESNQSMAHVEGINRQKGGVIEGFGHTELEAIYSAMLQALESMEFLGD